MRPWNHHSFSNGLGCPLAAILVPAVWPGMVALLFAAVMPGGSIASASAAPGGPVDPVAQGLAHDEFEVAALEPRQLLGKQGHALPPGARHRSDERRVTTRLRGAAGSVRAVERKLKLTAILAPRPGPLPMSVRWEPTRSHAAAPPSVGYPKSFAAHKIPSVAVQLSIGCADLSLSRIPFFANVRPARSLRSDVQHACQRLQRDSGDG
jgi:hypothetical protein